MTVWLLGWLDNGNSEIEVAIANSHSYESGLVLHPWNPVVGSFGCWLPSYSSCHMRPRSLRYQSRCRRPYRPGSPQSLNRRSTCFEGREGVNGSDDKEMTQLNAMVFFPVCRKGFEDQVLGNSPGWWADTAATYCPGTPWQITQEKVTKHSDRVEKRSVNLWQLSSSGLERNIYNTISHNLTLNSTSPWDTTMT